MSDSINSEPSARAPPVVVTRTRVPASRAKRLADGQLTPESEGGIPDDYVPNFEPQIADEATMATRKVVRVKRPEPTDASSAPSTSELFKNVLSSAVKNASFSTADKPQLTSTWGSKAPTAPEAPKATTTGAFGVPKPKVTDTVVPSSGFTFGTAAAAPTEPAAPVKSFSFGASGATGAPFSFGSLSSGDLATPATQPQAPAPSKVAEAAPTKPSNTPVPATSGSSLTAPPKKDLVPNVFGAGSTFSFSFNAPPKSQTPKPQAPPPKPPSATVETPQAPKDEDAADLAEAQQEVPITGTPTFAAPPVNPANNGESGEDHEFSGTLKLYVQTEETRDWVDHGLGLVKVNWSNQGNDIVRHPHGRLIMRTIQTKSGMLNLLLDKSFSVVRREEKAVVFTGPSADGKSIKAYLLKGIKSVSDPVQTVKDLTVAIDKVKKRADEL